jgi:hypothetical protein
MCCTDVGKLPSILPTRKVSWKFALYVAEKTSWTGKQLMVLKLPSQSLKLPYFLHMCKQSGEQPQLKLDWVMEIIHRKK